MSKSISLDLLTVIEHESRNFIWNNKIICIFAAKIYRFKMLGSMMIYQNLNIYYHLKDSMNTMSTQ